MWKQFLVILFLSDPILSKFSSHHVIENILESLELNLEYIYQRYDKINVDCLFGVVLAGVMLDDTITHPGPYQEAVQTLKNRTRDIYRKTVPILRSKSYWTDFTGHIVIPSLWAKSLKYRLAEFKMPYAMKSRVEALFSQKTYENFTEGMSDHCLGFVVNSTLELKPQTICQLSHKCEQYVVELEKGSGYMLTHKLLLLQLARARRCKMHPKVLTAAIKKVCTTIYIETISIEYFSDLLQVLDLFLEQILLCGYEGYADFLKKRWLDLILKAQYSNGCFPPDNTHKRSKRDTNIFKDGCADHTTGLAAGVFSLYLNYLLKNEETITLISEWF